MKHKLCGMLFSLAVMPVHSLEIDLAAAQQMAVDSSIEISAAAAGINTANIKNIAALRAYLPTAAINCSTGRQTNYFIPDSDSYRLDFTLNQLVFDGGRLSAARRMAAVNLELQQTSLSSAVEQLKNRTWSLYYNQLLLLKQLSIQTELLSAAKNQHLITGKKYNLGTATELDFIESELEVRKIEIKVIETRTAQQENLASLADLIGLTDCFRAADPTAESLALTESLERDYKGLEIHGSDCSAYAATAEAGNLELVKKRVDYIKAQTEYRIKAASIIPSLKIEASFYFQGSRLPMQETGGSIGLKLDFPFNPLPARIENSAAVQTGYGYSCSQGAGINLLPDTEYITDIKDLRDKTELTVSNIKTAETAIEHRVHSSIRQIELMRMKLELKKAAQKLSLRHLEITEHRHRSGSVRDIELMKERITYSEGEIAVYTAILQLMEAEREFETLLGLNYGTLKALTESLHPEDTDEK